MAVGAATRMVARSILLATGPQSWAIAAGVGAVGGAGTALGKEYIRLGREKTLEKAKARISEMELSVDGFNDQELMHLAKIENIKAGIKERFQNLSPERKKTLRNEIIKGGAMGAVGGVIGFGVLEAAGWAAENLGIKLPSINFPNVGAASALKVGVQPSGSSLTPTIEVDQSQPPIPTVPSLADATDTPTATPTETASPTATMTVEPTVSPEPSETLPPTETSTATATNTASATSTPTATPTPIPSENPTTTPPNTAVGAAKDNWALAGASTSGETPPVSTQLSGTVRDNWASTASAPKPEMPPSAPPSTGPAEVLGTPATSPSVGVPAIEGDLTPSAGAEVPKFDFNQTISIEKPGDTFFGSFDTSSVEGNWTNPINGVSKGDVVKDMVAKFAQYNGHDISNVHVGDSYQINQLLTPEQMQMVNETMKTQDANQYWNVVRPKFEVMIK